MMGKPLHYLLASLLGLTSCVRESSVDQQVALEAKAAGKIFSLLDFYDVEHSGQKPTNIAQVFALWDTNIMNSQSAATFQMEFRQFGKHAGFSNSFYEKYVVALPFLTNRLVQRDPVFMSAQPFPHPDYRSARVIIWRQGPQYHNYAIIPEDEIQTIFRKAAVPIPTPTPMPSLPQPAPVHKRSLTDSTVTFFRNLAEDIGLGRSLWFPVMITSVALFIGFVLAAFWFAFRRRSTRAQP